MNLNSILCFHLFVILFSENGLSGQQTKPESDVMVRYESPAAIAINNDGTIFVAGFYRGEAKIEVQAFELIEEVWKKKGRAIEFEKACATDVCGKNLDLSGDGKIYAFGEFLRNNRKGIVHIFEWEDNRDNWVTRQRIQGSYPGSYAGNSVSLSENGDILVVGEYRKGPNSEPSGAYIYERQSIEWSMQTRIQSTSGSDDTFGWSTAVSASGTVVAVGALTSSQGGVKNGCVMVYDIQGDTWDLRPEIPGLRNMGYFGSSVALSADGDIAAIGATGNGPNRSGEITVFQYANSEWNQIGQNMVGLALHDENGNFGMHISLSNDGTRVISVDNDKYLVEGFEYDAESKTWLQFVEISTGQQVKYVQAVFSGDGKTIVYGNTAKAEASGVVRYITLPAIATPSPTNTPTSSQTPSPTSSPTDAPTTGSPTTSPTPSPTTSPPTSIPTSDPTPTPTAAPTINQWVIQPGVVTTDSSTGTISVSHEIRNNPSSMDVFFYESDCETSLPPGPLSLSSGPLLNSTTITYDFHLDINETTSSSFFGVNPDSSRFFYFCSDLITRNDNDEDAGLSRIIYYVNVDSTLSLNVSASADEVKEIDIGLEFSATACTCNDAFTCNESVYQQASTAPLLEVCIFPEDSNIEITNFSLKLKSKLTNFVYDPVEIGIDGPILDQLTSTSKRKNSLKVTTRIVEQLFDGGDAITVTGSLIMGVGKQLESEHVELIIKIQASDKVSTGCWKNLFSRVLKMFR